MSKTETKTQEALGELEKWFASPGCREEHYDKRIAAINDFLENKTNPKGIFRQFDYLNTWFRNQFVYSALKTGDASGQFLLAQNSYFTLEISRLLAKQFPGNPPGLAFHETAGYLANVIIRKWDNEARGMLDNILEGLESKFLKGGQPYKIAAWFILGVAGKAFGKKLAREKYNYPKELGVYDKVIAGWDTDDIAAVDNMVTLLCDYHLDQASFGDGEKVMDIQFSYAYEFVYAYEVVSWLSLRAMKGLENPARYSHPLMRLPVNHLPEEATPFKTTDLYDRVLKRLKEEYSGLAL